MTRKSAPALWMGVAFAVATVLAAGVLAVFGTDENGVRLALRLTARWSFLLFWVAYASGALAVLFGPVLAPLSRRGREFGLAFAAAHLVHVGLVLWLGWLLKRPPLSGQLLTFFTVGIVWTYLLAALSFGSASQALGPRIWRLLRVVGMNYILLAFARDFVLSAVDSDIAHQGMGHAAEYLPFAAMCLAAPLLVAAAAVRRRFEPRRLAA